MSCPNARYEVKSHLIHHGDGLCGTGVEQGCPVAHFCEVTVVHVLPLSTVAVCFNVLGGEICEEHEAHFLEGAGPI